MKIFLILFIVALISCRHENRATVSCINGGVHLSEGRITFKEIDMAYDKLGCKGNIIEGSGDKTIIE